jgi:hypothetical protein
MLLWLWQPSVPRFLQRYLGMVAGQGRGQQVGISCDVSQYCCYHHCVVHSHCFFLSPHLELLSTAEKSGRDSTAEQVVC